MMAEVIPTGRQMAFNNLVDQRIGKMMNAQLQSLSTRVSALESPTVISGPVQTALSTKADKTYVDQRFTDILNGSPAALDTLKELADALGDDPSFATTIATKIGTKADASAVSSQLAQKADLSVTANLTTRMGQLETTVAGYSGRIDNLETWRSGKAAYLGAPISSDLKTDYNALTTVLSVLVGAMNTTNTRVNALAVKVASIQTALQTREITASA